MGGLQRQIAAAAGAACGPVDLVAVDSAAVVLAEAVSAANVSLPIPRKMTGMLIGGMRMAQRVRRNLGGPFRRVVALFVFVGALAACKQPEAPKAVQKTFASPEEAGAAFYQAAKAVDQLGLVAIFGENSQNVLFSGDAIKDKDTLMGFVGSYDQMHRWREIKAGGEILYIGPDNYAFPIPLGQNQSGQWYFDTAAGKDEILARRIGKDELAAIAACVAIANAQNQYFSQIRDGDKTKQYAQKFISDEGKQNGLYWPISAGRDTSPFEQVRDFAKAAGYTNSGDKPQPFNGYYYRFLTQQGDKAKGGAKDFVVNGRMTDGFAAVAYPADYRNSGIMTFIVGKDGVVYQKDLGEKTTAIAEAMKDYDPGDGWSPAI
jgi:hypothetical protein